MHREALALIAEGWCGESGSAATGLLDRQCGQAAELVAALHETAGELRSLRDVAAADRCYGRLDERPRPVFETPAPTPAYPTQPPAPPSPVWTAGMGLGGALAGVVGQIAGAVSQAGAAAAGAALSSAAGVVPEIAVPAHRERSSEPAARPAVPARAAAPLNAPAMKPEIPSAPIQPADSPLLAAERPPPPDTPAAPAPPQPAAPAPVPPSAQLPPDPITDARTPCEIAADELPRVGQ